VSQTRPQNVSLFVTCLVDQFYPQVGDAVMKTLRHVGVQVEFPRSQTCCGQPAFNSGYQTEAQAAARHFLEVFEQSEWIVAPSGSCAAMVRVSYPELFRDNAKLLAVAQAVSSRTYELSEFLVRVMGVTDLGGRLPAPTRVTYHDACHGLRELGIRAEPRALLSSIRGLELVELEDPGACCGFGGTFSVKYPEISAAILQDKLDQLDQTGADLVVAADSSCLMQISGGLSRRGSKTRPIHLAELLANSLEWSDG
jgi:L-lactate dehydrogenase complex protein LldE